MPYSKWDNSVQVWYVALIHIIRNKVKGILLKHQAFKNKNINLSQNCVLFVET